MTINIDKKQFQGLMKVQLNDKRLKKIIRLALSDSKDKLKVSYCWGITNKDQYCNVQLPFEELPKKYTKRELRKLVKQHDINPVTIGITDVLVISD